MSGKKTFRPWNILYITYLQSFLISLVCRMGWLWLNLVSILSTLVSSCIFRSGSLGYSCVTSEIDLFCPAVWLTMLKDPKYYLQDRRILMNFKRTATHACDNKFWWRTFSLALWTSWTGWYYIKCTKKRLEVIPSHFRVNVKRYSDKGLDGMFNNEKCWKIRNVKFYHLILPRYKHLNIE